MKSACWAGVWIVVRSMAVPVPIDAQAPSVRLDSLILAEMDEQRFPGVAAAAVAEGRILWMGTYGLADAGDDVPVTERTPFQLASVSKPLTATVLLSLAADGRFDLDDDIDGYVPFKVRNPNHPDTPITFRQLLRHRSSIADNDEFYDPHWSEGHGDPSGQLGTYLREYLSPTGADFDGSKNFYQIAPGAQRHYCNTCYALLGYLAEVISGSPFEQLSEEVLFEPLGMIDTAWFLKDLQGSPQAAAPHRFVPDTGYIALGHNGYPDWPAGQLRSSIRDVARFLAIYAVGGISADMTLIDPWVVDVMAPVSPDVGYHTWGQRGLPTGRVIYIHGGGDTGVNTVMGFHRPTGQGVVVLANANGDVSDIAEAVFMAIEALAEEGDEEGS